MATVAGSKALYTAIRSFKEELNELFVPIAEQASGILLRAAGSDGKIDPRTSQPVIDRITALVSRVYVGEDGKSAYQNTYEPLSPFAALINKWHVYTVVNIVEAHYKLMKRLLRNAPDVWTWLQGSTQQEVIRTNPLVGYDPLHTFVDPKGYTLSQKIWRNETEIRLKIDAMMNDYIRRGVSAVDIAKDFEQFLLPAAKGIKTTKPYGRSANANSLRLGRTEITAAHGRVTIASAKANPFVTGIIWRLAGSHKDSDQCDINAAGSPYPLDKVPDYPNHPNDTCSLVPEVTAKPAEVIAGLRTMIHHNQPAPLTVAAPGNFLRRILGGYLYGQAQRLLAALF